MSIKVESIIPKDNTRQYPYLAKDYVTDSEWVVIVTNTNRGIFLSGSRNINKVGDVVTLTEYNYTPIQAVQLVNA